MKINYSDQPVLNSNKSIFLAGPTPRQKDNPISWRLEAIDILKELKYDGLIYIPEYSDLNPQFNYDNQVEWEIEALEKSTTILFWIPRNLENMPAFTTNVEFGLFVRSKKIIYGRPINSPGNKYLDFWYKKIYKQEPFITLKDTLEAITELQKNIQN